MDDAAHVNRSDRHPGDSYEDILERDSRPVPAYLREGFVPDLDVKPVSATRYFDSGFFAMEVRHVWSKVWQVACREEDIPRVGDCVTYEVVGKSVIIVRTEPDTIMAFHNSCLHRGRKLVSHAGCRSEFKCPFHGITWGIDGRFKENPIGWDFPQWNGRDMSLPQAKVDCWGGFVFINFDLDAEPLMHFIKPLAEDFEKFDWNNRYRTLWIEKTLRCNWKAAAEAFMESHHSITTHPQILIGLSDANSQYDLLNDWVSRQFSASGVVSPFLPPMEEQEILNYMLGGGRRRGPSTGANEKHILPEGVTARAYLADLSRKQIGAACGRDYSQSSDAEMLDALIYNLFPNLSIWAGEGEKIVYRWRPNGMDPQSCIMDIEMYARCPKDQPRPKPAAKIELDCETAMGAVVPPGMEGLAAVFDQDFNNLPYVQAGLTATSSGEVHFGKYTEMRLRHLHLMIDRYIAEGDAA